MTRFWILRPPFTGNQIKKKVGQHLWAILVIKLGPIRLSLEFCFQSVNKNQFEIWQTAIYLKRRLYNVHYVQINDLIYVSQQSAADYDYQEKVGKHGSQVAGLKGFGGKFGVQTDRKDAAVVGFDEGQGHVDTTYEKYQPVIAGKKKIQRWSDLLSLNHLNLNFIL